MKNFTCYLAQTLPDIYENERDGFSQTSSNIPSWVFLSILFISMIVPLILWRNAVKKNAKKFNGESCITFGFVMLIVMTVSASFAYGIGFKGVLTLLVITVGIVFSVKLFKKWDSQAVHTSRRPSSPPVRSQEMNLKNLKSTLGSRTVVESLPMSGIEIPTEFYAKKPSTARSGIFRPKNGESKECSFGISLRGIEPGDFYMGSKRHELGRQINENIVRVKISKGFWIAKTQCTQEQWQCVMGSNPSSFVDSRNPVEQVSWEDANQFCAVLTKIEHESGLLPLEARWSLPSEAQWEFACRAGTSTALNHGKSIDRDTGICPNLNEVAWYGGNSDGKPHTVAQKAPNNWGLYDMHGNVWEWCRDWYHPNYVGGVDPCNNMQGEFRSIRGGGWSDSPWSCRSAARHPNPFPKDRDFGFRPIVCW